MEVMTFFRYAGRLKMSEYRTVEDISVSQPTLEGAGVKLRRAFGNQAAPVFDPFLLLDDFGSDRPEDYILGFPWHPHRGIETVTYMLTGEVERGDSIGNSGVINSGDVQWMTAGSGIIHQEMPRRWNGRMRGFQLWVNLPARNKMMAPRYRGILSSDIPEAHLAGGLGVKVIAGCLNGIEGPVRDLVVETEYLDVAVPAGGVFERELPTGNRAFAYVFDGEGRFESRHVQDYHLVTLGPGRKVRAEAGAEGLRFLLVSGLPLGEPVAWGGPIVMNTQEELERAFREYREGTFIKHGKHP